MAVFTALELQRQQQLSRMFFDAALGKVSESERGSERADNEQFAFETSLFTYGFGHTTVGF